MANFSSFSRVLLRGGSLGALLVASTAMAQQAPTPGVSQTSQSADAGEGQADAAASEIVVTGYRASLNSAQAAKRHATVVMEAITPQDLGKFTDASIADQLKRVPGVQIDLDSDGRSGAHASIRGMGPQFVTTTLNGRTPAGYGREGMSYLREFAIDVLPSEILSGAQIYKSPSAEMPEAGLGGEINFDTLRPLDYNPPNHRDVFGNITFKGTKNSGIDKWGKGVSGVFGAKLFDNTLGFFIAGALSNNPYKSQADEIRPTPNKVVNIADANNNVTQQAVLFPSQVLLESIRGEQKREAITAGLQFKPDDHLSINLDYTYSRLFKPTVWDIFDFGFNSDGTFEPGGITIQNGAATGLNYAHHSGGPGMAFGGLFPYQYHNDARLVMFGGNVAWQSDKFKAVLDVSESRVNTLMSANYAWIPMVNYPTSSVTNYASNSSGPATINLGAPSIADPSDYSTAFYPGQRFIISHNKVDSVRADFAYTASDAITLKAGVRYNRYSVDARDISGNSSGTPAQIASLFPYILPGGADCIFSSANGANCQPFQDPGAAGNVNNAYITPHNLSLAPFSGPFSTVTSTQAGTWNIGGQVSHANIEETEAAYAQVEFHGNTGGGLGFDGNFGLRVVKTNETAQGIQSVVYADHDQQTTRPISVGVVTQSNSYTNLLPAFNLTLHPDSDTNLRFSVAKTISRPEFEYMSPTNAIGIPDPLLSTTNSSSVGYAQIGNIDLKPIDAWNFDFTAEKYFHGGSSIVASLFYKKVNNYFVAQTNNNTTLPDYGSQAFNVTSYSNTSGGRAYGLEVGFHLPLIAVSPALNGFGIQANYTYTNSKIDEPLDGLYLPFLGASRHNANGTLYYSKGKIDARVAMVYRTSFLSQYPWSGTRPTYLFTNGSTHVDASFTYSITDYVDVTLTGSNLTKQNRRDFAPNNSDMMLNYITAPRTFAIALRAKI